ncbi:MAG: glycine zipper 2TM domain-containing protein [Alphaproteobacteria bacterium]
MTHSKISCGTALTLILLLSGCARDISSNTYKASHVGEASFTYQGVVANVREVQVEEGERLEENTTGAGLGALAGGVAGYQFGGGRGQIATTAAGAVLGGVAGAYAEKALKSQQGLEYVVRLDNGQIMTVVQGLNPRLNPGQRVLVLVSNAGRSRVVADQTGVNLGGTGQVQQPNVIYKK